ncbi:RTJK polymerase, partial [Polyodon spathula]|nr:RTJK polymerase [Polyodon spathula]
MENGSNSHATASGETAAPALGTQGAGEKWTTGQSIKAIKPKTEIRLAAWNVLTGHHVGQKEIIARELTNCKISIPALSELRLTGSRTTTIRVPDSDKTMTLYYSGGDKRQGSVGFIVDSRTTRSVIAFQPFSNHLAILTIDGTVMTHIVSIYAPTDWMGRDVGQVRRGNKQRQVMRKAFEGRRGVQCDENTYMTDLMFADNSAIFADTDAEATDILYSIAEQYGLKINADKTKVLTTDGSPANIHLDGAQIKQVQELQYLGSVVQEKKVASLTNVHGRIGQATAAFVSLKWFLWKRANISIKTKIRLFRTLILPILLYGSETWTLLKQDLNKLKVFQMRCLRQILIISLRDHIRNETIRIRCDHQPTVMEAVQLRRL